LREPGYQSNWEKEELKEKGIKLKERIQELKDCGIGIRFKNKTFSNFDKTQNTEAFNICKEYAKNFLQHSKEGKGLFLYGNVGTGKTHLAVAIVDYIARLHKNEINGSIRFITVTELLQTIKDSFKYTDGKNVIDRFKKCRLLIIDDMGTNKVTDWTQEVFYSIINYRYENLLPTIITTNLTIDEFKKVNDERLMSRIFEMCKGVKLSGEDHRIKINNAEFIKSK